MFSLLAVKEKTREKCRCFDPLPSYGSADNFALHPKGFPPAVWFIPPYIALYNNVSA